MENKRNNNSNNVNINYEGGIIMINRTIENVKDFAEVMKEMLEERMGMDTNVEMSNVSKNNGQVLVGLTIREKDVNASPTIYVEDFFERYRLGDPINDLCDEVVDIYRRNKLENDVDISVVTDFEKAKKDIRFKLINAACNSDLLAEVPHRIVFDDLALIYYVTVEQRVIGRGTVTIRNEIMESWHTDEQTLFNLASNNTPRLDKGSVRSISSVLMEMMEEKLDNENASELFDLVVGADDVPLYVCSNESKVFGAATVLYDGLLSSFGRKLGSDFYILPSSVHEVLFVPARDGIDVMELSQMVREVNSTEVSVQDYLSDSVYYYSLEDDVVSIASC